MVFMLPLAMAPGWCASAAFSLSLASECMEGRCVEEQEVLWVEPCMPIILEPMDICLSIGIRTAEEPGMLGSGSVPGMEAGSGCLCLFRRCRSDESEPGTGPICLLVEGAWVMTELDWGDGRACWITMLLSWLDIRPWDCWCWPVWPCRETFCLLSSSSWALRNSCSIEQSSSLKSPTSSQFFRKRVGVGVWSDSMLSFFIEGNFRVISCLCRWIIRWSSVGKR